MKKVWEVVFGYNFSSKNVIAKDVFEAIEKAKKLMEKEGIIEEENWISEVKLVVEANE